MGEILSSGFFIVRFLFFNTHLNANLDQEVKLVKKKHRIYVINLERRYWPRRVKSAKVKGKEIPDITRRYLLIVEHPKIREIVQKEFNSSPNAIHPHESGDEAMFYCIASPSFRRAKRLVSTLFYRLKQNNLPESELNQLEILTAGRDN